MSLLELVGAQHVPAMIHYELIMSLLSLIELVGAQHVPEGSIIIIITIIIIHNNHNDENS